jgi:hypothetical protein
MTPYEINKNIYFQCPWVLLLSEKCFSVKEKIRFLVLIHVMMLMTRMTARSTVILEKLTGSQLVKKFPAFHGTRRFITALTRARRG